MESLSLIHIYGVPYNTLSGEVRAAISDLAVLKYEVLKKVGDAAVSYTHLLSHKEKIRTDDQFVLVDVDSRPPA